MRILIIKTSSLGDVIHNLPIIEDIKKTYPNAIIDWVIEENYTEILEMHKGINRAIPVSIRRWRKKIFSRQTLLEITAFKKNIQSHFYDCVIDTQGLLKSGIITQLSRSIKKCGYDKNSAREPIASNFYHYCYAVGQNLHAVQRNRKLAGSALNYDVAEGEIKYGIHTLDHFYQLAIVKELPEKYILGFHGTSLDTKLWAVNQWIELGKKLKIDGYFLVLPWGNKLEKIRAEKISDQVGNAFILPKVGISSLAVIIEKSQAVVGGDTGLLHLAVALNKPAIGIYTETDPALTGLFGEDKKKFINLGNLNQKIIAQDVLFNLNLIL
jgi:heptosyltransferase-1